MIDLKNMEKKILNISVACFFAAVFFIGSAGISLAATNLIPNPSLTSQTSGLPTGWQEGNWGTNTASFTYPVAGPSSGTEAAQVTISAYPAGTDVSTGGDAKWYFNPIAVTPGDYYVFGDQYESNIGSEVVIEFHTTDGTLSYEQVGTPAASSSWQSFQVGFNAPTNVTSLTIYHLIDSIGTLTTGNFSLVQTTNPNAFPKGMVSLDFDDDWQSVYTNAIPILNAAGMKSTQYVITDTVNDSADGYMTLNELKTLYSQGHDIESHTETHPVLTTLSASDLQTELQGSRNYLLQYFSPVNALAYPDGYYNAAVEQATKAAGYLVGRTVDSGYNDKSTNPYALLTQSVERGGTCVTDYGATDNAPVTTLAQIKSWIDTAAATNTWLILVFHQIDNINANCYGDTPAVLQDTVNYLKTSNVNVVTVEQGLQNLNITTPPPPPPPPVTVLVKSITVTGAGNATSVTNAKTLQMNAAILPTNATNKQVTWSTGAKTDTGAATINSAGLLTATKIGTVTVGATATDGSGIVGKKVITVITATRKRR